ncbi:MAG TPA: Gfo/Idh/MocA family oxidoreductase [Candidatus Angelobacter sp.]|jgi:predicted dehydrogenase|nr:Gfo/Idh/MocA family oxidoreductase [Candidatus Angelobacter sp.]
MKRVGVVGLGAWGWNVARNFAELKDCKLVTCCDTDERRRANAARAWPGVVPVNTFDEMLLQEIDAVVISSPAVTHYDLAKKALLAGHDVFVEKPFTLRLSHAEELVELAEKQGNVLMVGHLLEYHPVVRRLKAMIQSGELGPLYYIYTQRVNLGRIRGDENALWSFAPHDISQILYLLDMEPTDVSVRGQSYIQDGIEDVAFVSLYFENRIMAHIHLSWLDPHKVRKTTIVGADKMAVFDDAEATEKLRIYDNHAEVPAARTYGEAIQVRFGDILIPRVDMTEPLKIECQHFVDCMTTRSTPVSDGRDGLRVVRILEAAQQSLDMDGVPVRIRGDYDALHSSNSPDRRWHAARA